VWAFSEAYVLLGLRSYFEWLGSSQVAVNTLILEHMTLQVAWHCSPTIISFLIPFSFHFSIPFMFLSLNFLICCSWVSLIIMSMVHHWKALTTIDVYLWPFHFHKLHIILTISCFSSLPLWSEPLQLLNHLVKFVSSGNLP